MQDDTQEEEQPFLFDDFFVTDEDPGVPHVISIRGRLVPIVCKRGLSLGDREAVLQASLKRHMTPDGKLVVDGIDTKKATEQLLLLSIKSWPFVYRDGTPVPVNAKTLAAFLAEGADQLAQAIQQGSRNILEQADGPFDGE